MPVWPVGSCVIVLFFLLLRRPRRSALFPYTTLFRSYGRGGAAGRTDDDPVRCVIRPWSGRAPSRARHTAVGFTLALAAIAYLDRICISTAAPAIGADLGLSDAEMGFVFSAFTLAYALFEVPSGWFADRFGARVTLARIVIWWSVMTAATGLATGFVSLLAVRLLFGVGEAGMFPATARAFARWLPAGERGRAFGLLIMTAALGGAASQPLVVGLLQHMGWRLVVPLFGSLGGVWAVAWWGWLREVA